MTDRLAIVLRRLHEQRLVGDRFATPGRAAPRQAVERFGSFLGLPASLHVG